jgi:hypothetical protein
MTSFTGAYCKDDSLFHKFGCKDQDCGQIKYEIIPPARNQWKDVLSFGFSTTDADALLSRVESANGDQYYEIKLKDGSIVIHVNLNNLVEVKSYVPTGAKNFNDNRYHVVKFLRERDEITFRVDNFEELVFNLKPSSNSASSGIFHQQQNIIAGALQDNQGNFLECFYGILSGMVFNGHRVLDDGIKYGDVCISSTKYIDKNDDSEQKIPILPDGTCPLGYVIKNNACVFVSCPLYSDFLADHTCRCYYGYYQQGNQCVKVGAIVGSSAKLIPIKGSVAGAVPIGLILGIISGIALALLAAALAARKCADGLCIPVGAGAGGTKKTIAASQAVGSLITSTTASRNEHYELMRREEQHIPLIQNESHRTDQEYYKDTLDFGYNNKSNAVAAAAAPLFTQSVNETMEMFEQTTAGGSGISYSGGGGGGGGGATAATSISICHANTGCNTSCNTACNTACNTGCNTICNSACNTHNTGHHHHYHNRHHHSSHRDLTMDWQNNVADYELNNVTCVTTTPNGKYAIIGQSMGTPQIWDTISGQLIRSMTGSCLNCSNLTLACDGTLLVGLASDPTAENTSPADIATKALHIWEVQSGKPVQMSHQIKCCVFAISADSNSIFMAGNQRYGRGISVGILDLVSNELTKEIKSDPSVSFGDYPESIVITPDERHAIVGCKSQQQSIHGGGDSGHSTFVVFDITKSNEIALTRSIALDADPKCIQVFNNSEMITGSRGGHLVQWNIHSCTITVNYIDPADTQAHQGGINHVALSTDKEYIVTASSDCTAKVWSTRERSLISVLTGHRGEVN